MLYDTLEGVLLTKISGNVMAGPLEVRFESYCRLELPLGWKFHSFNSSGAIPRYVQRI